MSEPFETIKKLIDGCSADEIRSFKMHMARALPHPLESEWGTDADTILSAIRRSSDLTKRGVRGIIAEAIFDRDVLPNSIDSGWQPEIIAGDLSYDALLTKGDLSARVQIKLQRLEKGVPKLYHPKHYAEGSLYVVEVQKTRGGVKAATQTLQRGDAEIETTTTLTVKTRPYRFGDFDVLAVNMHPSSGDWKSFRYTLAAWLLPRPNDNSLIEVFQPVAANPNDVWTDNLATALKWFEAGEKRRVLTELLHPPIRK